MILHDSTYVSNNRSKTPLMLPVCTVLRTTSRPTTSSSYSHSTTTTTIDLVVVLLVVGPATGTHFILPVLKYHGTHFRQSEQ